MSSKHAIVIHGLGRTAYAMRGMAAKLRKQGYKVTNLDYPSTRLAIPELVERFVAPAFMRAQSADCIDVVTHSLGGILFRYYLSRQLPEEIAARLNRAVMLAPPNQGSAIPDRLRRFAVARWILGPVMPQLGTQTDSIAKALAAQEQGSFPCDIGVIAGTRSHEPWFSAWLEGVNDGKVTVASARLEGMSDFIEVAVGHTFIMNDAHVQQQVLHFLAEGSFQH